MRNTGRIDRYLRSRPTHKLSLTNDRVVYVTPSTRAKTSPGYLETTVRASTSSVVFTGVAAYPPARAIATATAIPSVHSTRPGLASLLAPLPPTEVPQHHRAERQHEADDPPELSGVSTGQVRQ